MRKQTREEVKEEEGNGEMSQVHSPAKSRVLISENEEVALKKKSKYKILKNNESSK